MRKYFFGYHYFGKVLYPFAWVEEGGMPIGGRPQYVQGQVTEISEEDFSLPLYNLEKKYPYTGDAELTTEVKS